MMNIFLIFLIGLASIDHLKAQVCSTSYDPYITTFDGMTYGFQYSGDHYIMYDDFKNTRVTSGFQSCSRGSCNCAVYVQKNRKLMFVDFCNVQSNTSPTSKIYGVSVEQNHIGPKAIREISPCPVISSFHENNKATWDLIPTILGSFKCARLQGGSYYTYYLIRTVENHFEDSVLVKFQLANRAMPVLSIRAPSSVYKSNGGLCGRWDGKRNTDLYVLDQHGVESFLTTSSLSKIGSFWNLNSVYNKPNNYTKRCPECMLMSERSFYCPCDDFNLFDNKNYNLPPNRLNYCKVPMYACVEKHYNFINPNPTTPSSFFSTTRPGSISTNSSGIHTTSNGDIWTGSNWSTNQPGHNHTFVTQSSTQPITTTFKPISPEQAFNICWTGFMNHPGLNHVLNNGCLDLNITLQFCIDDITLTADESFLNIHIESSVDITIQNILTNHSNCDLTDLQLLCPNGCSGNGVCIFKPICLMPGIITGDCSNPIKCECNPPYGGADCSQDLTNIAEFTVNPQFCDLRSENCSLVNGFGYPFSTRDPIYVKVKYTEYDIFNRPHFVTETSVADTITDNNILIGLNRLSSLNLYKNIHSIRTSFVSRDTLADARIYISYSNASFVQWANLTLYDSKCRTEDEETGLLVFLDDRCDIEGVCYVMNQTNPSNPNFFCNPNVSIDSWTPTPDPLCNGDNVWTEWFNYDSPQTGEGDLELYHEHQYGCKYPSRVQARTVDGIPANQTGQVNWLVPLYGFFCFNRENRNGCLDYEIRQCCSKLELYTTTTKFTTLTFTQTEEFTTEWNEIVNPETELPTEESTDSLSSSTTSIWSSEQFSTESEQIHETTEWNEIVNPETELPTEESTDSLSSSTTSIWSSEQFSTESEQIHETTEWNEIVNPETELPTEESTDSLSSSTTSIWSSEQFSTESEQIHETTEWNEIVYPETELPTETSTDSFILSTTESELISQTINFTTPIYSTIVDAESTIGTISCLYTLDFDVKDNIVSFLESSGVQFLNFSLKTENDGCNELQYVELEILPESASATLYQDFDASNDTIIVSRNSSFTYNFTVLDDKLVEPFEFFVLKIRVLSTTIPSNSLTVPDFVYVYIQDDDYNGGQKDSKIFNIFAPEIASSDFFSAFYTDSAFTNLYTVENNQALFTDQGGFSIPFPNINIVVENTGIVSYKLHSVEVNNPEVCNIESFTIRRKRFFDDQFLDTFELKSVNLNGVAFVDVDFYKFALNLGSNGDDLQRMDIKVLSTKNGNNINKCEFRAFAEAN